MVLNAATRLDSASLVLTLLFFSCLGGCTGSSATNDPELSSVANVPSTQNATQTGVPPASSGSTPTITLTADQQIVSEGSVATLSWTAIGADSCTASGGWSGTLNPSGSLSVGPLSAATTFSLACSGPAGSALEMIALSVIGPVSLSWIAPAENVDGSPLLDLAGYRIYYGQSSRSYSDTVDLGDPNATSHTLNLQTGDYYVAMTAIDSMGNESGYSNEVVKVRL